MHFLFGVLIFTFMVIVSYLILSAYTPLAETATVILAIVFALLVEYAYVKTRTNG